MAAWEYWGDFSSTKDLIEFYGGSPADRAHYTLIDSKPTKKIIGVAAKGVPTSEMITIQGILDSSGTHQFTLADGSSVSGVPTNFTASPIEHTDLYNVKLVIRCDGSSEPVWHYIGDMSGSKEFMEVYGSAPGVGSYDLLNIYPVKRTASISAKGVPSETASGIQSAIDSGGSHSFSLADGTSIIGVITSCSITLIEHTTLYDVKISLRMDGVVRGTGSGVQWHAYGAHSMERQLTEFYEAPNNGRYGNVTFYSLQRPKYTISVSAENVPAGEAAAILGLITNTAPVNSFSFGSAGTGIPISASMEQVKHTDLYNVKVTLRVH